MIEVPEKVSPAGTTDPAKQVGLILRFQEHDTPTGNDLFPVRQSLDDYILLAAAPQGRKFGKVDHEPLEKLIAWVKKTYPINPLDRLSAVDAIGYAVRFQVKGVRQDPAMFARWCRLCRTKRSRSGRRQRAF